MRLRHLSAVVILAALAACSDSDSDPTPPPGGEPNDTPGQATPIGVGAPVGAVISTYADVDFYRFGVPAGGAFVHVQTFDGSGVTCSSVDTYTELFSGGGGLLQWDDDSGPSLCDEIVTWLPEGTYFVAVSHGGAAAPAFAYALLVTLTAGTGADSAEAEPNGSVAAANGPYVADALVSGSIAPTGDSDYFAITNTSASSRTVYLETFEGAVGYCPNADSTLAVYDDGGWQLTSNDDGGILTCSYLSYTIPAYTTYYVRVAGYSGDTFSYLLEIDFL